MSRVPNFDELVGGGELSPQERERLRRAHELLLRAGPPPELPPSLERPPATRATVSFLPRRRRSALALVAAAVVAAAFGGGYLAGHGRGERIVSAKYTVPMHGTSIAPEAVASIVVLDKDESGNWPMLLKVRGLEEQPRGGYYELYLTKKGKLGPACGGFRVHGGTTEVRLNAPYRLKGYDGWVVTEHVPGDRHSNRILMTT